MGSRKNLDTKTTSRGCFLFESPEHNAIITLLSNRDYMEQVAREVRVITLIFEVENTTRNNGVLV